MKTIIPIIALIFFFSVAQAQVQTATQTQKDQSQQKADNTAKNITLKWSEKVHDFKEIPVGTPVTATFTFKNIGIEPVTVTRVKSSCGCTVASYSKEPVLPGKEGEVSATYNAARQGPFNKSVNVYMSNDSQLRLSLKGKVIAKE